MEIKPKVGLLTRMLASWVDFIIVFIMLKIVLLLNLLLPIKIYIPTELAFIIIMLAYSLILIALKGRTIGKYLLNIRVVSSKGNKLHYIKAILRETILKIVSAILLFLGFLWIRFTRRKKGWHDYLVRSEVVQSANDTLRSRFVRFISAFSLIIIIMAWGGEIFYHLHIGQKIRNANKIKRITAERDDSLVRDLSELTVIDDSIASAWISENSLPPEEYAVKIVSNNQITIFGEVHGNKAYLDFLNKIVPKLYSEAGIRVIALEFINSSTNKKIEKLVNASEFDETLALKIAQNNTWRIWGYSEYWNILRNVWLFNKNLKSNEEKIRIIGIDSDWVGPHFAMIGLGDDGVKNAPVWEKLKLFTTIGDFAKLATRDEFMAKIINDEIIKKGEKGIVWVGLNHSFLNWPQSDQTGKTKTKGKDRLGKILKNKYCNNIFQIALFNPSILSKEFDEFFIRTASMNINGIGFTVAGSPYAMLRDSGSYYFKNQSKITFNDIAQGVIYIKPKVGDSKKIWLSHYVSDAMFVKYKPFYEAKLKQKFKNAQSINDFMSN
jgi:uncharacterized RDD family membrane protein YckC